LPLDVLPIVTVLELVGAPADQSAAVFQVPVPPSQLSGDNPRGFRARSFEGGRKFNRIKAKACRSGIRPPALEKART
jgi:hypothetical protein